MASLYIFFQLCSLERKEIKKYYTMLNFCPILIALEKATAYFLHF